MFENIFSKTKSDLKYAFIHAAISLFMFADASCSNEAVHLQQRLRSLSTELVTLRNTLNQGQGPAHGGQGCPQPTAIKQTAGSNFPGNNNNSNVLANGKSAPNSPSKSTLPPPVLPRTSLPTLPITGNNHGKHFFFF